MNNTWERAPWADALYACDDNWWQHYQPAFKGERWTQSERAAEYGARRCPGRTGYVLSQNPAFIHFGGNSGFQAVNLAYHMGAARIVLAGFDMQVAQDGRQHWHDDHKGPCHNPGWRQISKWAANFDRLADQLIELGVEPVNASIETALRLWPRMDIGEALDS